MARLLKTQCPQCHAPLKIDAGDEVVTCEFCGNSSVVQRGTQAPPRTAATAHMGTIQLAELQRAQVRKIVIAIVALTVVGPLIGVGACLIGVLGTAQQAVTVVQTTTNTGVGTTQVKVEGPTAEAQVNAEAGKALAKALAQLKGTGAAPSVQRALSQLGERLPAAGIPVHAADLSRVDGLELLRQARAAARKIDGQAQLSNLYLPRVVGGAIDVQAGDPAHFTFSFDYRDERRPPGEDSVRGQIHVSLHRGTFTVVRTPGGGRTLPEPRCSTAQLWRAAVASDVPDNAVAKAYYLRRGLDGPTLWRLTVDGHPEHTRELSADSCELLSR